MLFKELKKSLNVDVRPIYLLTGEDAFFLERSQKLICDACLKQPDINLSRFDGAELKGNVDKLIYALSSYPFLSDKRVVVVKEYYPLAADLNKLKKYFSEPIETTVLIVVDSSPCDALEKQKNVCVVDCSKGDFSLLSSWVINEVKKNGLTITQGAVNRLIDYCSYDMTRINGETEKLISYCDEGGIISENDVSAICHKETDYELYEVVDYIAGKKYDKAYDALMGMVGSAGDGLRVFTSLYNYFRRLLYVSVTTTSMSVSEIAKNLKVKEYAVKKAKIQAASFSPKRIKEITDKLASLDVMFKSGRLEQQDAVWNAIMSVLAGGNGKNR
ncbi:MAG: DNA polymerase III subunit delta [Clostridia bacterium]|nr:DNA polymerase III subunit delta [Clostridia bacterium]